ncbi:unnamed protein product [Arabis nemorensis]|uniref:Uncharacterized protein n=1 Tax=Arabis nemorensis TaxID=586526 RepID=A0A565C3V4_9BRAS|nr:unnamed protein product [Arabis nemorensis]
MSMCTKGREIIHELIAMEASFDHGEVGNWHSAREGGHSHRRILHATDMTRIWEQLKIHKLKDR